MAFRKASRSKEDLPQSTEPVQVGDVLSEVVDLEHKTVHTDPEADKRRKLMVASRLTEVIGQTLDDELKLVEAGEERDKAAIVELREELLAQTAEREGLSQQLREPPQQL